MYVSVTERPPEAARIVGLHRVVYYVTHGTWPTVVRHACDHPWCANPAHLQAGTAADNNRDTRERGHYVSAQGERNGHARLTAEDIRAIRASPERNRDLARRYGVDPSHISHIKRGDNWRHL
jgi:hypothetical protein